MFTPSSFQELVKLEEVGQHKKGQDAEIERENYEANTRILASRRICPYHLRAKIVTEKIMKIS